MLLDYEEHLLIWDCRNKYIQKYLDCIFAAQERLAVTIHACVFLNMMQDLK